MKGVVISGESFEDLKKKIDSLPRKAKPLRLIKPASGSVIFKEYKGFHLRRWGCKPWVSRGTMTRYDTAYEV